MTGPEFRRWYWLKSELMSFARSLGVSASGSKAELTDRVAAALDGESARPPARSSRRSTQLGGPLSTATVIPEGQRCSQPLRAWFTEQVGPGFRFDAAMRDFIASSAGTATLGDAVDHWHATRNAPPHEIGAQFEFNRFTRMWYRHHPGEPRAQLLVAWRRYRELPADGPGLRSSGLESGHHDA